MKTSKLFDGFNVFISRHLFPPHEFDTVLKAVEENGGQVHIGFDLSRNGENDYHIISCRQHYKFQDLKSKGCKMIGYRCVLQCAKEGRPLPRQAAFTCCLTMEAVKILAYGFDADQMVKIDELMIEMGGALHTTPSSDLNSVIVKNVWAPEYKWALNVLKKPIVSYEWLKQCSDEHQVVPQESYMFLPFSGLKICVTGIQADKRKEMEKLILQNGGKYSAELTKKCTHLISNAPEGDKHKMAKLWGHINIVTMKWFDESIAQRACLNEESYPVQSGSLLSRKVTRNSTAEHSQEKDIGKMQSGSSSRAADSNILVHCAKSLNVDPAATQSKHMLSVSNVPLFVKEADAEAPPLQTSNELNFNRAVANVSESDDDDRYLADCRISLVGFEASEMEKLSNMVRKGGGSQCLYLNDKLTHIVIGNPTEVEREDVVRTVALGVNYAVKTSWLEDCDREKKQVHVLQRYSAYDILFPKGQKKLVEVSDRIKKKNLEKKELTKAHVDLAQVLVDYAASRRLARTRVCFEIVELKRRQKEMEMEYVRIHDDLREKLGPLYGYQKPKNELKIEAYKLYEEDCKSKGIAAISKHHEMGFKKAMEAFGDIAKESCRCNFVTYLNDPVRKENIENHFKGMILKFPGDKTDPDVAKFVSKFV
ncbi:uncharacterized protein [Medicago truncatula]|uniref:uncharacterized protein isoform X2 n=1 Tax=Medicago truncatula TaxID=3880 RepID=UPI001968269F|nr:uncharacterized protein LOC11414828 isoform X2 [Medicago truncatula]